jgi:hypothetical protein
MISGVAHETLPDASVALFVERLGRAMENWPARLEAPTRG